MGTINSSPSDTSSVQDLLYGMGIFPQITQRLGIGAVRILTVLDKTGNANALGEVRE